MKDLRHDSLLTGRGGPATPGGDKIRLVICVLHGKEEKGAKTAGPAPGRATWLHYLLALADFRLLVL